MGTPILKILPPSLETPHIIEDEVVLLQYSTSTLIYSNLQQMQILFQKTFFYVEGENFCFVFCCGDTTAAKTAYILTSQISLTNASNFVAIYLDSCSQKKSNSHTYLCSSELLLSIYICIFLMALHRKSLERPLELENVQQSNFFYMNICRMWLS